MHTRTHTTSATAKDQRSDTSLADHFFFFFFPLFFSNRFHSLRDSIFKVPRTSYLAQNIHSVSLSRYAVEHTNLYVIFIDPQKYRGLTWSFPDSPYCFIIISLSAYGGVDSPVRRVEHELQNLITARL